MNKTVEAKGNISKHLQEMLQTASNTSTLKRKSSPEKVLNPPNPISPPRMFVDFEPGKIVSQSLKIQAPLYL